MPSDPSPGPSLLAVARALDRFLWQPTDLLPLAAFRALLGAALLWEALRLLPHCADLYASDGVLGPPPRGPRARKIDLLSPIAGSRRLVAAFFAVHCVACAALTVGFATNLSALLIYLNFASRGQRAPAWFHGGDAVATYASALLALSPAGGALSLDAAIGLLPFDPHGPPIALRTLQLFVCFVYLRTTQWKFVRSMWLDGTAIFVSVFGSPFSRRTPGVDRVIRIGAVSRAATWSALLVEAVLPFGFWFRETRRATIAANTLLHLGIAVMLRMKAFQWIMLATGALFLTDQEVLWATRKLAALFR
jgi:hypothetical protein